ncbi:MAG: DUF72 domain-containing protein [Pseudomonadales bacterium]
MSELTLPYKLGCPMWGNRHWANNFFAQGAKVSDYLLQYSSVFNTVEGNTTFYGLPSPATVQRWAEDAGDEFRFCFKFPQRITHAQRLRGSEDETNKFFTTMEPIAEKLGPFLLQLPPDFSPESLPVLSDYLRQLPKDYRYTVEVRHLGFFHDHDADDALSDLLQSNNMDRVIFDTRPLFSARAQTEAVRDAQNKKPKVPANTYALSDNPSLRFIGHPQIERSQEYFRPWLRKIAAWIEQGKTPYVFIHTPDNADAPELARLFHAGLQEFLPTLSALPAFPAENQQQSERDLHQRNHKIMRADVEEHQYDLF